VRVHTHACCLSRLVSLTSVCVCVCVCACLCVPTRPATPTTHHHTPTAADPFHLWLCEPHDHLLCTARAELVRVRRPLPASLGWSQLAWGTASSARLARLLAQTRQPRACHHQQQLWAPTGKRTCGAATQTHTSNPLIAPTPTPQVDQVRHRCGSCAGAHLHGAVRVPQVRVRVRRASPQVFQHVCLLTDSSCCVTVAPLGVSAQNPPLTVCWHPAGRHVGAPPHCRRACRQVMAPAKTRL
jgi:hypothetical protein